jgi:ubiquinol-cytochrome c reductase cytochrome c subunit
MKTLLLMIGLAAGLNAQDGNAEKGKKIFLAVGCYECHGTVGQGTVAGARIGPPPLNTQGFIRYIRKPGGVMPAFTDKVLTDQDLTDVYAYLKTVPAPKAVKDIPLLNDLKK